MRLVCVWTLKPDCEEARLLAGLPEVLLPERSVNGGPDVLLPC